MPSNNAFLRFWSTGQTRSAFLSAVSKPDLISIRLVCREFSIRSAPILFENLSITFSASTFGRQSRLRALESIGHHVKAFSFRMPHTSDTFLPPLIDPRTGEHVSFVYQPCIERDVVLRRNESCYGSWEMSDLLIKQYPPIFHAAANVPAFIKAFSFLRNLRSLQISCPGQVEADAKRRSSVDFALISLRIAVERNNLLRLRRLALKDIHPGAVLYLNPQRGFAALPNSSRKWKQIKSLSIRMTGTSDSVQLKHLHSYLFMLSTSVRRFDFEWAGKRSPFPMALDRHPEDFPDRPSNLKAATNRSGARKLQFTRLREFHITNASADADQIADFIICHHNSMRYTKRMDLDFNDTILRKGTWESALEPLTKMSGDDDWKASLAISSSSEESSEEQQEDSMDVPIMFIPDTEGDNWKETLPHKRRRHRRHHHHYQHEHQKPSLETSSCRTGAFASLHQAGTLTKDLLFGTEEHMRRLFGPSFIAWA